MGKRGPKPSPRSPMADPLVGVPDKPDWLDGVAGECGMNWSLCWRKGVSSPAPTGCRWRCSVRSTAVIARHRSAGRVRSGDRDGERFVQAEPGIGRGRSTRRGAVAMDSRVRADAVVRGAVAPIVGTLRDDFDDFLDSRGDTRNHRTIKMS